MKMKFLTIIHNEQYDIELNSPTPPHPSLMVAMSQIQKGSIS